jgi:hypothetical protein
MPGRDDPEDPGGGVAVAIQRAVGAELRRDLRDLEEDVKRVDRHVDRLDVRVDGLDEVTGKNREAIGKLQGEMSLMGVSYQRIAEITTKGVMGDLEIKKLAALAEIRERTEKGKARRKLLGELAFKGIAIAMGIWGLVYAAIAKGC